MLREHHHDPADTSSTGADDQQARLLRDGEPEDVCYDVIIIGAGFAGSALACTLAPYNLQILLLDRQADYPPVFRADKLEQDQVALLKALNLFELRVPIQAPWQQVLCHTADGHYLHNVEEQYGLNYRQTVGNLRRKAQRTCDFMLGKPKAIEPDARTSTVTLEDGRELHGRLVVLATGGNRQNPLLKRLGIIQHPITRLTSLSFAWNLEPATSTPLDVMTWFGDSRRDGLDLATLFHIGDSWRMNVFTQWAPRDPQSQALRKAPMEELRRYLPAIDQHLGEVTVTSAVNAFATSYYRLHSPAKPGLVVIGDEYQSVSPSTGRGLSKLLTDVHVLRELIPQWLAAAAIGPRQIAGFYQHPAKRQADQQALHDWQYLADNAQYAPVVGKFRRRLGRLWEQHRWMLGRV